MSSRKAPPQRIGHALGGVVLEITPQIAAIAAFVAGVTILASAATPTVAERLRILTSNAPLFVVEVSHFAASLVGLLLMLVGSGLWRRREGAFWVALTLLLSGAILSHHAAIHGAIASAFGSRLSSIAPSPRSSMASARKKEVKST